LSILVSPERHVAGAADDIVGPQPVFGLISPISYISATLTGYVKSV
jgi:hypothetical protein